MKTRVLGRGLLAAALAAAACGQAPESTTATPATTASAPVDPQHQGLTAPHGDHTPHRGGLVLMNADVHYEIVFSRDGRHRVWFSDAVRNELPASVATGVVMAITREGEPVEVIALAIDDTGESWVAAGRPVVGDGAYVKINYALTGDPHEVEIPFVITPPSTSP